jgi:4-aminobutyrate aminotransferase/(S)-3-amino-2-methylpropionate transaminase
MHVPTATDLPLPDALPEIRVPPPGPLSRAALASLAAHESPNVTAVADNFPVVWQSARGCAVRDVDGNTYVDATSAFGVALLGHGHPEVVAAVQRQAGQLLHGMGDVHPPAVRIALLEALTALAPGDLGHAVLCGGGSEAVEVAQKTALLATGKPGILAFSGSYHGMGHGALDVTSRRDFRAPFTSQLAHNTTWLPFPDPSRRPVGVSPGDLCAHALERVEQVLAHPAMGGVPVGAILIEPIQGRGGVIVPPDGFLAGLRALCDRHGCLLIFDEIFTGCGRTGALFVAETVGVVPDLLCVGKALGGGMPIAACLGRPHVMAAWPVSHGEALHTSTFLGHPVAAAAALATMQVLVRDNVAGQALQVGASLRSLLERHLEGHPWVREIRGYGLMIGVELHVPKSHLPASDVAWRTVTGALARGVILLPCGVHGEVIQLTPPAVMTYPQQECVVHALRQALDEAIA